MGDKQHAARVAWATITCAQAGQRPVSLDQLATHVHQGRLIPVRSFHAEARRLVDRREATPPATPMT
jgi:hypothetical protein